MAMTKGNILNLGAASNDLDLQESSHGQENLVHVRIQQRNGRKTLTTVQGISQDYDLKKIAKECKKVKLYITYIYWFMLVV